MQMVKTSMQLKLISLVVAQLSIDRQVITIRLRTSKMQTAISRMRGQHSSVPSRRTAIMVMDHTSTATIKINKK